MLILMMLCELWAISKFSEIRINTPKNVRMLSVLIPCSSIEVRIIEQGMRANYTSMGSWFPLRTLSLNGGDVALSFVPVGCVAQGLKLQGFALYSFSECPEFVAFGRR